MSGLAASAKRKRKRSVRYGIFEGLFGANPWAVFACVVCLYSFLIWYLNGFLDSQHRMNPLWYCMIPLALGVKICLVTLCIITGLLFTSTTKLTFAVVGRVVLFAESAFVSGLLFKMLVLSFSHRAQGLEEIIGFAPMSLYSLLPSGWVPFWLSIPLQALDVFQLAYIALLAAGLSYFSQRSFRRMIWLVLATYGVALLCCMTGFAVLTFSNS